MSHSKKISVVVLGHDDYLKKALITIILGRHLSPLSKPNVLKKTEIHENDTLMVICTPDLTTSCDDIREIFAINPYPDITLLVVEDGFSTDKVWQQVEKLEKITGKPTEEFIVVLPLSSEPTESYPFRFCTLDQLFSELHRLATDRHLRYDYHPESNMTTPHTPMEMTGDGYGKEICTVPKKSLKRDPASTKVNLVLLGMTGTGKSASGNIILGGQFFESRASSKLVTKECQAVDTVIGGRHVRVIDTPDIFDDQIDSSVRDNLVSACKQFCQSGPCVYLLVMQASRFTDGERDILDRLETAFGRIREQTVILFTCGGDLKRDNISHKDFFKNLGSDLKTTIEKCGNRRVLFDNKASRSDQVKKLMQTVDRVLK